MLASRNARCPDPHVPPSQSQRVAVREYLAEELIALSIGDLRAERHWNLQVLTRSPRSIRAFSVPTPLGCEDGAKTQVIKSVQAGVTYQVHGAPRTTIAPGGSPARDKLLPPKSDTAVASTSGSDMNDSFIEGGQCQESLPAGPATGRS